MQTRAWIFLPLFCVAAGACSISCSTSHREHSVVTVISVTADAQIIINSNDDGAYIQVLSQSGIGHADLEIISETVPKRLILQFHLQGLEELRFVYGESVVTGSISSTESNRVHQSVHASGGKPEIITSKSSYWMPMRLVSQDTTQIKIPLQDGYIEIEAPEDFLKSKHRRFSIHWVDFFR